MSPQYFWREPRQVHTHESTPGSLPSSFHTSDHSILQITITHDPANKIRGCVHGIRFASVAWGARPPPGKVGIVNVSQGRRDPISMLLHSGLLYVCKSELGVSGVIVRVYGSVAHPLLEDLLSHDGRGRFKQGFVLLFDDMRL